VPRRTNHTRRNGRKKMCRHLEINVSKEDWKHALETRWRAMNVVRADEDIVISFDTKHLKSDGEETVPVSLEIYEYKEVETKEVGP
jgi:hypothetical protein